MYAIVKSGGHQYRVAEGDVIEVHRLDSAPGATIELDEVLMVGGERPRVGTPVVDGARVKATVLGEARGRKVVVFKYKNKNRYRIKTGHRQTYTRLRIDAINA